MNEESVRNGQNKDLYDSVATGPKGTVTWVQGDFFDDAWLKSAGSREFDVIFDYTVSLVNVTSTAPIYTDIDEFLCALPPDARPKWAQRMSNLLTPETGVLICLEWPLGKDPSIRGPAWGLASETYVAHLAHPGEDIRYGDDGKPLADEVQRPATDTGLKRLTRLQPRRTHQAGHDSDGNITDYISVWGH